MFKSSLFLVPVPLIYSVQNEGDVSHASDIKLTLSMCRRHEPHIGVWSAKKQQRYTFHCFRSLRLKNVGCVGARPAQFDMEKPGERGHRSPGSSLAVYAISLQCVQHLCTLSDRKQWEVYRCCFFAVCRSHQQRGAIYTRRYSTSRTAKYGYGQRRTQLVRPQRLGFVQNTCGIGFGSAHTDAATSSLLAVLTT